MGQKGEEGFLALSSNIQKANNCPSSGSVPPREVEKGLVGKDHVFLPSQQVVVPLGKEDAVD
ncbi:hypothetical protein A2U01_0077638, partial [Trifolium medium]|nr:hypothetical protein [Trifolium medium]